jgi:hypothetical protein
VKRAKRDADCVGLHVHFDLYQTAYADFLTGRRESTGTQGSRSINHELGLIWNASDMTELHCLFDSIKITNAEKDITPAKLLEQPQTIAINTEMQHQ